MSDFTNLLVKSSPPDSHTLYQTDLLDIQIANSKAEIKSIADQIAMSKNLSVIDFSECEDLLKETGFIGKNDSLIFSKTDWDSSLKTGNLINVNETELDSVSYSLYTTSGMKVDMNLCSSTTTNIMMHLKNLNTTTNSNITAYDIHDVNSPYYNDRCIVIGENETTMATVDDKRENFDNLNYTCSGDCEFQKINTTNGYLSCDCNSSISDYEISPQYGRVILKVLENTNIEILKCYNQIFIFVNIIF